MMAVPAYGDWRVSVRVRVVTAAGGIVTSEYARTERGSQDIAHRAVLSRDRATLRGAYPGARSLEVEILDSTLIGA